MFSTKCDEQKYVNSLKKYLKEIEMAILVTNMYAIFDFYNDKSNKNNANLTEYIEKRILIYK